MDMLHPVMQQALRPFLLNYLKAKAESEVHYTYRLNDSGSIHCVLEFEPADDGAPERGLPTHKPTPASMTLVSAMVKGVEMLGGLSPALIKHIEREALESNK